MVEDAAHAPGARFEDGSPIRSSGNLTCFSFYANKNLSTAEGGAVVLFDEAQAQRIALLRQHGLRSDAWKRYIQPNTMLDPHTAELGYKVSYTTCRRVEAAFNSTAKAGRLVVLRHL